MNELDPYAVLGIPQEATPDDVKIAYRRAARRLHPDVNRTNPGAGVQFQDITAAYELLLDPQRRQRYDNETRQRRSSDDLIFTARTVASRRAILPLEEPQVIYLLTDIIPDLRAQQQPQVESRLNLTLVLDHSKSMDGTRLEKVKVAAHQIVDQLKPEDVFSVISFNDFAEVVVPATAATDKPAMKARISLMNAAGGTEIFRGLAAGVEQNRTYLAPKLVNHVLMLTDGRTYGDEEKCLALAREVSKQGISISAMGLGHDWNDHFLDELAALTGGHSEYINSHGAVVRFMNDHVRNLSNVFAERLQLSIAPDHDIRLESAFKLAPSPGELSIEGGYIPLGNLQAHRSVSVLLQLEIPAELSIGFRSLARVAVLGDILSNRNQRHVAINDLSVEVVEQAQVEEPPANVVEALEKLNLYRMQERAQQALDEGNPVEATKRLDYLAARLGEMGEEELAQKAREESQRVALTSALSEKGRKDLKYNTRHLLLGSGVEERLKP
jgi:Ca-activated chloride channel family protein